MSAATLPAAGVISRELDGQMVLVSPEDGKIRVLNATGAAIWRLLQSAETQDAIVGALARDFDIPLTVAKADVTRFIEDLLARGLLTRQSP